MGDEPAVVDGQSKASSPIPPPRSRDKTTNKETQNSLGNANIAGLTKDLQLSSAQYSMAVVTFYCKLLHKHQL